MQQVELGSNIEEGRQGVRLVRIYEVHLLGRRKTSTTRHLQKNNFLGLGTCSHSDLDPVVFKILWIRWIGCNTLDSEKVGTQAICVFWLVIDNVYMDV